MKNNDSNESYSELIEWLRERARMKKMSSWFERALIQASKNISFNTASE